MSISSDREFYYQLLSDVFSQICIHQDEPFSHGDPQIYGKYITKFLLLQDNHLPLPPMGLGWPGVYELRLLGHCALRMPIRRVWSPLTHCARSHSLLERRELGVVLLRNRHVFPRLWISRREALEVRGIYGFEMPGPKAIRVIARVGLPRVPLWTNHGTILGKRKDVWPRRPHGIKVRVQVEIVGQRGLHETRQPWAILNERDTYRLRGQTLRRAVVFVLTV